MPALYVISFARTKKINCPISKIEALTSDLIYYFEVCMKNVQVMFRNTLHRCMGREAFPGLGWMTCYSLLAYNRCQKSLTEDNTPASYVFTERFITLKMTTRLTFLLSHFPAFWLSGQNVVVLSTVSLGMLTELFTLAPRLLFPT